MEQAKANPEGQGYTVAQVAKELGRSERQVERYIAGGRLSAEWVKGKRGRKRLIKEIPEELLAVRRDKALKRQSKPPDAKLQEEPHRGDQVVIDTRVVKIHWGVYVAIAVCLGLAIASLIVALYALDVAYWIGGG